jgi:hypothetical protein
VAFGVAATAEPAVAGLSAVGLSVVGAGGSVELPVTGLSAV